MGENWLEIAQGLFESLILRFIRLGVASLKNQKRIQKYFCSILLLETALFDNAE